MNPLRPPPEVGFDLFGAEPTPPPGYPGPQSCAVCKSRRAWFGYKIKRDVYRFACDDHRAELERYLEEKSLNGK